MLSLWKWYRSKNGILFNKYFNVYGYDMLETVCYLKVIGLSLMILSTIFKTTSSVVAVKWLIYVIFSVYIRYIC